MHIKAKFKQELTQLINRHSIDNDTNTPDFILAQMMCRTVQDVYELNKTRDKWFNFKPFGDLKSPMEFHTPIEVQNLGKSLGSECACRGRHKTCSSCLGTGRLR